MADGANGNLAFAAVGALARAIRERRIGCVELLEFYLDRAARYNPELNAIVAWQIETARARARQADAALAQGEAWGVLHGIPMTVKDSFDVIGLPSTFGSPALANNIAQRNAVLVDRLLAAGAVIFGKTNVPLMLTDTQSFNEVYGTTNNPWDLQRTPGGSSGGGAATLAAGMAALEAGSDIAGSLRNPAHYTGIYSHKPSFGLVPTDGHALPGRVGSRDLSVVGPMARAADDLAVAMQVLVGAGGFDASALRIDLPPPRATRLGDFRVAVWTSSPLAAVDDAVTQRIEAIVAAVRRAGARIDDSARPHFDMKEAHRLFMLLLLAATNGSLPDAGFAEQLAIARTLASEDASFRATNARAATLHHRDWLALNEARTKLRLAWQEYFRDFDVLLTPVAATAAFPHDHNPVRDQRRMWVNGKALPYDDRLFWPGLASCAYLPATMAPAGLTAAGLPVGVQIIGPLYGDRTTIEFARLLAAEIGGFIPPPRYSAA